MSTVLAIILIVIAVLAVVFFVGGYIAVNRRNQREHAELITLAEQADQHLAQAHAEDKGWERAGLEAAARSIYAQQHGAAPATLMLVQVVDMPGTDNDEAVFHADGNELRLGRRDGEWVQA